MSDPTHRMVFVGGAHRSGTTLVARVLAAHPAFAGLEGTGVPEDEGQHLQEVLPAAIELGGPTRWALHPAAHVDAPDDGDRDALRRSIEQSWEPFWSSDAPYRVEKSPPNVTRMRFLQALWPDARFIVITRHPMIQSLAVQKWDHNLPMFLPSLGLNIRRTLDNWFAVHESLAESAPDIGRLLVIRYEHLMTDPERELARIAGFLRLDSRLDASLIQPGRSDAYRGFIDGQRTRRWGPHAPVMARRHIRTAARRRAFAASWAVVSRVDSATGRYSRIARRYEARARLLGYSMLDLDDVQDFAAR